MAESLVKGRKHRLILKKYKYLINMFITFSTICLFWKAVL